MTSLLALCVCLSAIAAAQGPTTVKALLDFSIASWRATPKMQIEDAYKWLYQATLGGEHAITDDAGPRKWLDSEWETLGAPTKSEPLLVKLTPNGELMRVNFRPYRARGGDKEMLLALFVESANRYHAGKLMFLDAWRALGAKLESAKIGYLTQFAWKKLDAQMKPDKYPPIEHSEIYLQTYKPAYRVILGSLWIK